MRFDLGTTRGVTCEPPGRRRRSAVIGALATAGPAFAAQRRRWKWRRQRGWRRSEPNGPDSAGMP